MSSAAGYILGRYRFLCVLHNRQSIAAGAKNYLQLEQHPQFLSHLDNQPQIFLRGKLWEILKIEQKTKQSIQSFSSLPVNILFKIN
jgi:hypothetical protein